MEKFSHIDEKGKVKMVDITDKSPTVRSARAAGEVYLKHETINQIIDDKLPKGNVLTTAKIAGIQAAKKTADLIPMCHQLNLSFIDIKFEINPDYISIKATVKTKEATGVEMEALSAVFGAAITIYDMCKSIDNRIEIKSIKLEEKIGGKSDHATDYRPNVGIITLSDSVSAGTRQDISGKILADGFLDSGCSVEHRVALEDGSKQLVPLITQWVNSGVELILTSGGTGLGPRDLTIETIDELFDSKLTGIEQALHSYGRGKVKTAMLSRLTAGLFKGAIIIALPGSKGAANDALKVLIPTIFHSFHMMRGEQH